MNTRRRRSYKQAIRSRQYRTARGWLWICVYAGMAWYIGRYVLETAHQLGLAP